MKFRNSQLLRALCVGALTLPVVSVACSDDHEGESMGGASSGAPMTGGAGAEGGREAGAGHGGLNSGEHAGTDAGPAGGARTDGDGGGGGSGDGTLGGLSGQGGRDEPGTPSDGGGGVGGDAGASAAGGQPGRVCTAWGTACLQTLHCPAGTYCANFECEPAPGPGSPCIERRCAAGATCSDGFCIPLTILPEGSVCEIDCPGCVCEGDLACHITSAIDDTEHCVPPVAGDGESCWSRPCIEGFYCQGSLEFDVPPTCVPNAEFDGFCGDKWRGDWTATYGCQAGLTCYSDWCIDESSQGEECGSYGTRQCAAGLYCLETSPEEGTCQAAKIGTPCDKNSKCQDGYCFEGYCHERAAVGEDCRPIPCEEGATCNVPAACQFWGSCDLPPYVCFREAGPGESCDDSMCRKGQFCMPTDPE
jgi:hypothetical protein